MNRTGDVAEAGGSEVVMFWVEEESVAASVMTSAAVAVAVDVDVVVVAGVDTGAVG